MIKDEVNKKYCGKYVEITKSYDHIKKCHEYIVLKSYSEIRENTTLGEDVGTPMEYCRQEVLPRVQTPTAFPLAQVHLGALFKRQRSL